MPVPLLPQHPTENGAVIFVAQPFLAVLPHPNPSQLDTRQSQFAPLESSSWWASTKSKPAPPPTPAGYSPIAIRSVRIFFLVGFH